MATKTEIKAWLKDELNEVVKPLGFKIGTFPAIGTIAIYKENDLGWDCIWFDIDSNSIAMVVFKRVEAIEGLLYKTTGVERYKVISNTIRISIDTERYYYFATTTREDLAKYLEHLKVQFPSVVEKFNYYAEPKHILELWDSLEKKDEKGFFQTSFKYCNILVISRLCNDPKYDLRKKESLEIYKKYLYRGLPVKTELEACEKIIEYFEENKI